MVYTFWSPTTVLHLLCPELCFVVWKIKHLSTSTKLEVHNLSSYQKTEP